MFKEIINYLFGKARVLVSIDSSVSGPVYRDNVVFLKNFHLPKPKLREKISASESLPQVVENRPPLYDSKGSVNRQFGAEIKDVVTLTVVHDDVMLARPIKKVFVNTEPLTRSGSIGGYSRKKVIEKLSKTWDETSRKDGFHSLVHMNFDNQSDIKIQFSKTENHLFFTFDITPYLQVRVYQECKNQIETHEEAIKTAYVIGRCVLLNLDAADWDIRYIDEDVLSLHILKTILI